MPPVRRLLFKNHHVSHGPRAIRERELYRELQNHNANGEMVTYELATDLWVPYARPIRVTPSGTFHEVAASGFRNLRDGYEAPLCPHAADQSKDPKHFTMTLHLRVMYQGRYEDVFRCDTHPCNFIVLIPRLKAPVILQTQEQIDEYTSFQDDDEAAETREAYAYDQDFLLGLINSSPSKASTSSVSEVEHILAPRAGSSRTPSVVSSSPTAPPFKGPVFSSASSQNIPGSPNFNPRLLPSLSLGERQLRPSPRPMSLLSQLATARSFFTEAVATARKNSDTFLMTDLFYNEKSGLYKESPSAHIAWDSDNTPLALQAYDDRLYPGCTNRIYQNLDFFTTTVGSMLRELNSTLGVPKSSLQALVELSVKCDACGCMFSPDGYNRHIDPQDSCCKNMSNELTISKKDADIDTLRALKMRSFADPAFAETAKEFLDTPIGIAFLEWNSRMGIPMDVFVVITTAYVDCWSCKLSRTFPAHRAHLNDIGECPDLGEVGATLVKGKGKGREIDVSNPEDSVEEDDEAVGN